MNKAYIIGGLRSLIGLKGGIHQNQLPEDLGAKVLRELIQRYKLAEIDEIIGGNAVGPGGNITRVMMLKAGVSEEIPAFTIDAQCGSASRALSMAYAKIKAGEAELIISGGFESSSMQPLKMYQPHDPRYDASNPTFTVAQFSPVENDALAMLKGAERVIQKEKITKSELDFWVLESHRRAQKVKAEGIFKEFIVLMEGETLKEDVIGDEGIRPRMSQKLLDRLKPLLGEGSSLTAANTCLINDGAAFIAVCSEGYVKRYGLKPIAEVIGSCSIGVNPLYSPTSALKACDKLLEKANLNYEDISAFEFNEAFAAIDVLFERAHPHLISRYNTFGGALAYGHPYGASGGIIMLHLLKALEMCKGKYGVTSIAAAGGIGEALLIKRLEENEW